MKNFKAHLFFYLKFIFLNFKFIFKIWSWKGVKFTLTWLSVLGLKLTTATSRHQEPYIQYRDSDYEEFTTTPGLTLTDLRYWKWWKALLVPVAHLTYLWLETATTQLGSWIIDVCKIRVLSTGQLSPPVDFRFIYDLV